jgi:glucose/arabinose dehydrogenase
VIRRAAVCALAALAVAAPARGAQLTQVGTFSSPVSIAAAPGDPDRLYVVERAGVVRVLVDGVEQAAPFLDIHDQVGTAGAQGLLSMAIDPASPTHAYVYYTALDGHIRVDRFDAPTPGAAVGPGTAILDIPHPDEVDHYGGQLQFGPDGKLYAITGDGGGVGDPHHNAQKLDAATPTSDPRLGKLLRMNPDGTTPSGNPFPAPADLVWALGLRNAWRWSFDRLTGALVIADVGQSAWEEVDVEPSIAAAKGANFGWDMREGAHDYGAATDTPGPSCCTDPVLEHSHDPEGWSAIIGGYVMRDRTVPELDGRYVYGDLGKGDVYAASLDGGPLDDGPTGMHVDELTGFGEDAAGHLYAVSLDGPVYRIVASPRAAAPPPPPPPATGAAPQPPGEGAPFPPVTPPLTLSLRAASRQRVLHTRSFVATAACNQRCALTVSAKRTRARHVTAAAQARVRVVLHPSRHALRLWSGAVRRRHHRLMVSIRVSATDASGTVTAQAVKVRVLA